MEVFYWKKTNCHAVLALAPVMCVIIFRGVMCQENITSQNNSLAYSRGDAISTSAVPEGSSPQLVVEGKVVCVDEASVRDRNAVKLKLKTMSSCEENKAKIQSILEHLCVDGKKLQIYQKNRSNEMTISGECVEGDVKGMTDKFNNDNIKDKVGVLKAESVFVNNSNVLISVLIAGLLLAALLIAAYILKSRHTEAKGARLDEELFQVDEQNHGNTLLSVAPLPPQEPVEKPSSNGESLDSPPTNGHSASQSPVADSMM